MKVSELLGELESFFLGWVTTSKIAHNLTDGSTPIGHIHIWLALTGFSRFSEILIKGAGGYNVGRGIYPGVEK